ncbi:hypothetical protein BDP27DRAFT_1497038 [Rhodocollybia butyracea]|uniref:Uncharacterized protein n=1 Tax=Rhodocollybia butyracea TaxID=206335 RepID=A0A9P5P6A9_9AGAR|nr:hypothetical protein BDP27DRAFT_1497038 [Rhodocollybia butyracea]
MSGSSRISVGQLLNPEPNTLPSQPSIPISRLLNPLPASANGPLAGGPQSRISVNTSTHRRLLHQDYRLNPKTRLSSVYLYHPGSSLEYPETGANDDEAIGHVFSMEGELWHSPGHDFAYSRGPPKGNGRQSVTVPLLVDSNSGEMIPCIVHHSTCQGVKICPLSYISYGEKGEYSHSSATREDLQERLRHDRELEHEFRSPTRDVFERTSALITAIHRLGCSSSSGNLTNDQVVDDERSTLRRGYPDMPNRCTGRIIFGFLDDNHYFDCTIGNGQYDVDYIEAILTGDHAEVARIEDEASRNGYGPETTCYTIINHSAQRLTCPWNHRDPTDGILKQPKLVNLGCNCTYREYVPLEEYRQRCPFILIVSRGVHSHPIPLPEKTPASVKSTLDSLFKQLDADLADMTPRLFLRHPIVKSHLKVYIDAVKKMCFPAGTGWKGLLDLKSQQDTLLSQEELYIRSMVEIPVDALQSEEDDVPDDGLLSDSDPLRIAVCMTVAASSRLIEAQYLQSDIAFKRVVGFYEFEIASVDQSSNTSITFCRVFLTRQTAFAHKQVLELIDNILFHDTGRRLRWRHIHGANINDYEGYILNWVVDQHGGQGKGFGLYLCDISRSLPPKLDFHEPDKLIQDLDPYDHLRRFLSLCITHYYRNIRKCSVADDVRNLMRSLACIHHEDWGGTLEAISTLGGKAGQNWLADKKRSKFAFAAICWEQSFIPLDIWRARRRESNIVETVHADVNLEGTQCTLIGAVEKGRHYDILKQSSLKVNFSPITYVTET